MDKWIKAEAIAAVVACIYPIAKDLYAHFSSPESQSGGGLMNWIPLFLCAVLLFLSMAMYKEKWPFNRRGNIPKASNQASLPSATLTLTSYPLTLVSVPKYAPAKSGSTEYYRDKVTFVVRNSYDQSVETW